MAWEKTSNPFSVDNADPLVEKNILETGMLGGFWGTVPVSSKELDVGERLLSNLIRDNVRAFGPSGWYNHGIFTYSGGFPANVFHMGVSKALIDGLPTIVVGVDLDSEVDNVITLNAPPGAGTHDDLVFVEVWLAEVPGSTTSVPVSTNKPSNTTIYKYGNVQYGGTNIDDDINEVDFEIRRRIQVQYRIRVVSDVDFGTYPQGINDPVVLAQGAAANPTAIQFAVSPTDAGLFVAGNGSVAHQGTLGTVDGLVLALPIARVVRTAGVTVITAAEVTDLRTDGGLLNFVQRTGDTMTGNLTIQKPDFPIVLVEASDNDAFAQFIAKGKEADGTVVETQFESTSLNGAVGTRSDHILKFLTNNTDRYLLDTDGILQTAQGDWVRDDGNSPRYESAEIDVIDAAITTLSHGLDRKPKYCWAVLRCKTAEFGYVVDDEYFLSTFGDLSALRAIGLTATDSTIKLVQGAGNIKIYRLDVGNEGEDGAITNANWKIIVRADP